MRYVLSIAPEILIPVVDWNPPYEKGGFFDFVTCPSRDQDSDAAFLAKILLKNRAFTRKTHSLIAKVDVSKATDREIERSWRKTAAEMYVERLLSQAKLAGKENATMVLTEVEVAVFREMGIFLKKSRMPTPFEIPDLIDCKMINGEAIGVISSFVAKDINQVLAARNDRIIQEYSEEVWCALDIANVNNTEEVLISALRTAKNNSDFIKKYDRGFKIFSWVTKPLSYVPVLSQGATMVNDAISLFRKWTERKSSHVSWHLLGARLQEVAINEFLSRKDNWGR